MPGILIVLFGISLSRAKQLAYLPLPPGPWLPLITGPGTVLFATLIRLTVPVFGSIHTWLSPMIPTTAPYTLLSAYAELLDNVKGTGDWACTLPLSIMVHARKKAMRVQSTQTREKKDLVFINYGY